MSGSVSLTPVSFLTNFLWKRRYQILCPWPVSVITFIRNAQIKIVDSQIILKEESEDTKGVIRICTSKKNRQHNGQKKKDKRTNNDLQHTHKTKDRVTRRVNFWEQEHQRASAIEISNLCLYHVDEKYGISLLQIKSSDPRCEEIFVNNEV